MVQQVLVAGRHDPHQPGQICIAPTRFLVHSSFCDEFGSELAKYAQGLKVRDGLREGTRMGSLVNPRRVSSMIELTQDVIDRGASVAVGGERFFGETGSFSAPTVRSTCRLRRRSSTRNVYLNIRSVLIHND
jgi:succinate-semialdehyde dehydrogenase/glutarate-semialdehyde dehydrogenase